MPFPRIVSLVEKNLPGTFANYRFAKMEVRFSKLYQLMFVGQQKGMNGILIFEVTSCDRTLASSDGIYFFANCVFILVH